MADLKALAINLLLYKLGWFGGVVAASRDQSWLGILLIAALIGIHLRLVPDWRPELRLVLSCGLLGAVADSVQVATGVLTFDSGQVVAWLCPPWIILMWMQMGTTLRYCLRFLRRRYLVAAVLGGVAGPLSFYAGERMGAVVLHPDPRVAVASLAVTWVIAMPLMMWLAGPGQPQSHAATAGPPPGRAGDPVEA